MRELKNGRTSFLEKNRFFILLVGIMLGGVLIGALAYCSMNENSVGTITILTQGFIQTRASSGTLNILINSLLSSTIPLLIVFILGFSAISQPIELIIPFFKGLGLGASLAQIYAGSGLKGFIIIICLILPYAIITCFALIIAVREAIRFSSVLTEKALSDINNGGMKSTTRLYCIKFLVLEVIMIIGAIVDCICSFIFAGLLIK